MSLIGVFSSLFVYVIWFLVIITIVRSIRRNSGKKGDGRGNDGRGSRSGMDQRKDRSQVSAPSRPAYSAGTIQEKKKHMQRRSGTDMSTTEYLKQKASLDEAEHREEQYRQAQRNRWETGGLPAAMRLYEGDSVPGGMRSVKCSYCGADNLIPLGSVQRFTCYFCREEL